MKKACLIGAVLTVILVAAAHAQPYGPGRGWGAGMMGPGMMGGLGYGRMCGPYAAGFAEWRTTRLERLLKPTDAQRDAFATFKKASTEATEIIRDGCPKEFAATATARMDAMEKRMESLLKAIKTVRPAFDALYATLSAEQKALLDDPSSRRGFWWR